MSRAKNNTPRSRPAGSATRRYQALDGLRGIAALLVVLLHIDWLNHLTDNRFVQNGYIAVDLFFILSGFVMSANYLDRIKTEKEFGRFLGLRFFRLYPLHFAMLVAFACLEGAKFIGQHAFALSPGVQLPFTGTTSLKGAIASLLLLNGLHVLSQLSWNGPSWSISCECAAYVLFGLAALSGVIRRQGFLLGGALCAIAAYLILAVAENKLSVTYDWGIARCLAGFFLGVLVFCVKDAAAFSRVRRLTGPASVAVILALICLMAITSHAAVVLTIPLFVMAVALLQRDEGIVARFLVSWPLSYLGKISYSVYMVHAFVFVLLNSTMKRMYGARQVYNSIREDSILSVDPWVGDLLVLAAVLVVITMASATYVLIEEPGRRYGRKLLARGPSEELPSSQRTQVMRRGEECRDAAD